MKLCTAIVLPALIACLFGQALRAQTGTDCPDRQATNVGARTDHGGPSPRCGFGVSVFGLELSVGGARCFRYEFIYPAHQECKGAVNPGTACMPAADMPVGFERCECLVAGAFDTGISIPKCSCSSAGTAGTIEDAQTVTCHASP